MPVSRDRPVPDVADAFALVAVARHFGVPVEEIFWIEDEHARG